MIDAEPKAGNWPPFPVYDMVQCGYPLSDHGEMIKRNHSGDDENGHLLPPKGMWCKVEDAVAKIHELECVLRDIALSLGVGGYNSPTVDPKAFYDKISWGIDEYAKSYHQLQLDLAAKAKKEIFEPLMIDSTKDD